MEQLCRGLGVDPAIAGVFFRRGIQSCQAGEEFLDSSLTQLHDPHHQYRQNCDDDRSADGHIPAVLSDVFQRRAR